ncbi:6-phosphogluconolactonase [Fundidesulfovibrio soli]|uniref:6-phosphogluconolactonase n=1 Tax=Fundidesulfovibrio soli TaxID=2922716 RepID=UPI001FAF00B4|nr:6-phosphogluconolactonase [Fundidesulfovibrio soli]
MTPSPEIERHADPEAEGLPALERHVDLEAASQRAAQLTARAAREAVAARGAFTLAVSGGSTPGRYFELLAGQDLPWAATHLFWVDERMVPPEDARSNYGAARGTLLARLPEPPAWVHRIKGEEADPARAAEIYRKELKAHFGGNGPPAFDCLHLGLGGDGHTASLFPGQPALGERTLWAVDVAYAGADPPVPRVSLTLPVLNAARLVFFLASGREKAALATDIAAGRRQDCPAALVRPEGRLLWILAG